MKLKSLKMQGFKSFADKTTIDFTDGVTTVVGPNGSGKSNIIEAIRWVMGETSAKSLRGEKMADVIFSGTTQRRAINFAEVTLVLDNSDHFLPIDFEEVMITRRLSRTGQSDYYINKQSARMKDITNLFTDSGLGKESFSIISQGQVEAIFNSKPEGRRAIFEEAAGVLKYKKRKQEAEDKLDETKENLDRVQDILFEIESQLTSLKRDSDKAKNYLAKRDELHDMDIQLTVFDISQKNDRLSDYKSQHREAHNRLQSLNTTLDDSNASLKENKALKDTLDEMIEEWHEKLVKIIQEVERTESASQLFDEKGRQNEQEKKRIENDLKKFETVSEELEEKLADLEIKINGLKEAKKTYEDNLGAVEEKQQSFSGSKEEALASLRSDYLQRMQEQTSLNNDITYLEKTQSQLQAQKERLENDHQEVETEAKTLEEASKTFATNLEEIRNQLADLLEKYKKSYKSAQENAEQLDKISKQRIDMQQKVQFLKNKKQTLKEMEENYTGYYQGVRSVMKQKNNLPGIIGTVAELIEVPDKYQEAVDIALGSSSQFIVVENQDAGRHAIDYLRQNNKGRATFLPVSTMKSRYVPQNLLNELSHFPRFAGVASDVITFDADHRQVIENLLGHILLTEDLQSATQLAKQLKHRYRIVSLAGDVINIGGSMTGGAKKRSQSQHLFSQSNDLKKIEETLPQYEEQIAQLTAKESALQERASTFEIELEELQTKGETKRLEERDAENALNNQQDKKTSIERQLQASEFERQTILEEIETDKNRLTELEEKKADVSNAIAVLDEEIANIETNWEQREVELKELAQQAELIQEKINEVNTSLAGLTKEQSILQSQAVSNKKELEELEASIDHLEDVMSSHSKEELDQRLSELKITKENLEGELHTKREKREKLNQLISEAESEATVLRDDKEVLQEQVKQAEIHIQQLEDSIGRLLSYLNEEYSMSYESAFGKLDAAFDSEKSRPRVKELKQEIKAMGPVNIQAIEEYTALYERYDFLATQQNDLIQAKEDLLETMDKLDDQVRMRFKETFDAIQEQFSEVFPKMFGGGRAELILTDPEDLLHSGVDIKAQPPGKNLQHLSLLSGGERALTAISLLFAIIQTRPVPFVILDEVEAALDEANVIRFSHYLANFEEDDIQFIVITHRKGTMEVADTLYGVVMQEKGVSSIVSVRLSEVDKYVDATS